MQTVKMLGSLTYQADIKPKGARNFRRADMSTLFEYEIASITAADMVRDAVVVMPVDNRLFYSQPQTPKRTSYAGWESALWCPMTHRDERLTVEQYERFLRGPRDGLLAAIDPIFNARIASASSTDRQRLSEKDIYNSETFVGTVNWTNKPDAVTAHNAVAKLIIAVDGEIWRRHPGPTWEVHSSDGYEKKYGTVLLSPDAAYYPSYDLFRIDRLDQARELCVSRFGRAQVHGEIEQLDPRFVTRNDIGCMFHSHLKLLIQKGEQFVPYLTPAATQAFVELHRALADKTPLTPFATTDTSFVTERLALMEEVLSDRALPHRLLELGKEIIKSFRAVEERIRLDRRAYHAETTADDEAITSLSVNA